MIVKRIAHRKQYSNATPPAPYGILNEFYAQFDDLRRNEILTTSPYPPLTQGRQRKTIVLVAFLLFDKGINKMKIVVAMSRKKASPVQGEVAKPERLLQIIAFCKQYSNAILLHPANPQGPLTRLRVLAPPAACREYGACVVRFGVYFIYPIISGAPAPTRF